MPLAVKTFSCTTKLLLLLGRSQTSTSIIQQNQRRRRRKDVKWILHQEEISKNVCTGQKNSNDVANQVKEKLIGSAQNENVMPLFCSPISTLMGITQKTCAHSSAKLDTA